MTNLIELIRVSVGRRYELSHVLTADEWAELYSEIRKQSLLGFCFAGIEALPKEQRPPRELTLNWIAQAEYMRMQYEFQCDALIKVIELLEKEGLKYRLLKGLALSELYRSDDNPKLCPQFRALGDFDLWVRGDEDRIVQFAGKYGKVGDMVYHHLDAGKIEGVEVELHFHPSSLKNVRANDRMQKWFDQCFMNPDMMDLKGKSVKVNSLAFNRIYVLSHIYRHLLYEGVGLRQFMDYYFVLMASRRQSGTHWEYDKQQTRLLIRKFKMEHFSNAVTWVLLFIFAPDALTGGVNPDWTIGHPDERRGRTLLNCMLKGGNFGMYDKDLKYALGDFWLKRYVKRVLYDLKFIFQYPEEVLYRPVWFISEHCRKKNGNSL